MNFIDELKTHLEAGVEASNTGRKRRRRLAVVAEVTVVVAVIAVGGVILFDRDTPSLVETEPAVETEPTVPEVPTTVLAPDTSTATSQVPATDPTTTTASASDLESGRATVTILVDDWLERFSFEGSGPLFTVEVTSIDGMSVASFEDHAVDSIELKIPPDASDERLELFVTIPSISGPTNYSATITVPRGDQTIVLTVEGRLERIDPPADTASDVEIAPTPPPAGEGLAVQLPKLSNDAWLVGGLPDPLRVVRTDEVGRIVQKLWAQNPALAESGREGHSLWCSDVDADGEVDLVDVFYTFESPLSEVYREVLVYRDETISESNRRVSGATVPAAIYEYCGAVSGQTIRITKMQLTALLELAGFSNISGDHAIDPTWAAAAMWNGVEYFPIDLYQGEFRPDPGDTTELLMCGLGALLLPLDLPADARAQLVELALCAT